ncbi:hypothetical protein Tmar_1521 [Thermaerobacter marianensis DSM 12885]|uniref:Uncharacterized protein n=1 Tax=Thermaerobacter marianensis (strain ATCC 700841 / DSM 12885 / JCM 10246 / 7p75a) TaxID=644966 RepID=E6SGI0_THEM7|nr:DUF6114 domain-containing protein [Thermaerobacter marianensis]ADU51632.1 hypothetical protein Tmar_1521 [Thermaerobacter marianensis DSM 12885]
MECAICGAVLGVCLSLFLLRHPVEEFGWGVAAGGLAGGALLYYVLTHGEATRRRRDTAILAVACLIPGLFLADHLRTGLSPALAATLGLLWSGLWCGLAVWFQGRLAEAAWYVRYHGELAVVLACSMTGSVAGHFLAQWAGGTSPWSEALYWVLPTLLAVTASLIPGAALSRQPYRPVLGTLLGFLSGGLVLWFGIQVAPMLFLPGSGLLWAGTVIGIAILVAAIVPVFYPKSALVTGLIMIGLSILSFIGATGGLIAGGLVGILAGAMFASWEGQPHGLGVARPTPDAQETTGVVMALGNDEEPAGSSVVEEQSHEASG